MPDGGDRAGLDTIRPSVATPIHFRPRAEIARFFDGLGFSP